MFLLPLTGQQSDAFLSSVEHRELMLRPFQAIFASDAFQDGEVQILPSFKGRSPFQCTHSPRKFLTKHKPGTIPSRKSACFSTEPVCSWGTWEFQMCTFPPSTASALENCPGLVWFTTASEATKLYCLLAGINPSYFILEGELADNLQGEPVEQCPKCISQQSEAGKHFSTVIGRFSLASLHVSWTISCLAGSPQRHFIHFPCFCCGTRKLQSWPRALAIYPGYL